MGLTSRPHEAPEWAPGFVRVVEAPSPWGPAWWLLRPAPLETADLAALSALEVESRHLEGWRELLDLLERRALTPRELLDPLRRALRGLAGLSIGRAVAQEAAAVHLLCETVIGIGDTQGWLPLRLTSKEEVVPATPTPSQPICLHWTRLPPETRRALARAAKEDA